MIVLAERLHDRTGMQSLCLGGGVAQNCAAVSRLATETAFDRVFVPPAPGDDGAALGAAFAAAAELAETIPIAAVASASLGPALDMEDLAEILRPLDVVTAHTDYRTLTAEVAERLARGEIVAWLQNRAEFGPRALGSRSILADPRKPALRDRLNATIKERESFCPFAPAVLLEYTSDWFETNQPSPFMQRTCRTRRPEALPAVTHVDGTARIQTVDRATDPGFAAILDAFAERTGCPVLLNTSFNLSGEPIALTVQDAVSTFIHSRIDSMAIGNRIIERQQALAVWGSIRPPARGEGGRPPGTSVYKIF
jgi:carbamoyltransferase